MELVYILRDIKIHDPSQGMLFRLNKENSQSQEMKMLAQKSKEKKEQRGKKIKEILQEGVRRRGIHIIIIYKSLIQYTIKCFYTMLESWVQYWRRLYLYLVVTCQYEM